MITAAAGPDPATSHTVTHNCPVGRVNTSYQSPPTAPLPGMYRAAISAPATAGSAEGTRLRCSAVTAAPSAAAVIDCTAAAARSPASCNSSTSRELNRRDVSHPTCSTPIPGPPATIGTPAIDRIPLAHRIGFITLV